MIEGLTTPPERFCQNFFAFRSRLLDQARGKAPGDHEEAVLELKLGLNHLMADVRQRDQLARLLTKLQLGESLLGLPKTTGRSDLVAF